MNNFSSFLVVWRFVVMHRDGYRLDARFGRKHDTSLGARKKRTLSLGRSETTFLGSGKMQFHMPSSRCRKKLEYVAPLSTLVVSLKVADNLHYQMDVYSSSHRSYDLLLFCDHLARWGRVSSFELGVRTLCPSRIRGSAKW